MYEREVKMQPNNDSLIRWYGIKSIEWHLSLAWANKMSEWPVRLLLLHVTNSASIEMRHLNPNAQEKDRLCNANHSYYSFIIMFNWMALIFTFCEKYPRILIWRVTSKNTGYHPNNPSFSILCMLWCSYFYSLFLVVVGFHTLLHVVNNNSCCV